MEVESFKYALMLRAARGALNLGLKDVGDQVGISSVSVAKWENGSAAIKASTFGSLQKFYKYNGVIMELNADGEPCVRLTEEGVERIAANPKKPKLISLEDIAAIEMQSVKSKAQESIQAIQAQFAQVMERLTSTEDHPSNAHSPEALAEIEEAARHLESVLRQSFSTDKRPNRK